MLLTYTDLTNIRCFKKYNSKYTSLNTQSMQFTQKVILYNLSITKLNWSSSFRRTARTVFPFYLAEMTFEVAR